MIEVNCPDCTWPLRIPLGFAGQWGKCNHCGHRFMVPELPNTAPPPSMDTNASQMASGNPKPIKDSGSNNSPEPRMIDEKLLAREIVAEQQRVEQAKKDKDAKAMAVGCLVFAGIFVLCCGGFGMFESESGDTYSSPSSYSTSVPVQNTLPPTTTPSLQSGDIEAELRNFASHEYPNDADMQRYIYKQQLSAYQYMQSVSDAEVRGIAVREYPSDYSMQQYVYDQQIAAKRHMASVTDRECKAIALHEYPNDYSMQEYTYDNQLSAKEFILRLPNSSAKSRAVREYPNDYTMQKYIYEQSM